MLYFCLAVTFYHFSHKSKMSHYLWEITKINDAQVTRIMMKYLTFLDVQNVHMSEKYCWKTNYGAKIVCLAHFEWCTWTRDMVKITMRVETFILLGYTFAYLLSLQKNKKRLLYCRKTHLCVLSFNQIHLVFPGMKF